MDRGRLIAIEALDSGQLAAQTNLLSERLRAVGHDVETFEFPRGTQPSGYFVNQYLEGNFGPPSEVSPYTASIFYALDHYEAAPLIRQALSDGKIVLVNHYAGHNMAFQGSKFGSEAEQRGFFLWDDSLEFQLLGIPRPIINIYMKLQKNKSSDLKATDKTFEMLGKLFPKDFTTVDCAPSGKLLGIAEINDLMWGSIKTSLPAPSHPGGSRTFKLDLTDHPQPTPINNGPRAEVLRGLNKGANIKATNGSLLLSRSLWSVPGALVSTSLVWQKAKGGGYYIPSKLPMNLKNRYKKYLQTLAESYKDLEKKLQKFILTKPEISAQTFSEALQPLIPMAALADMNISIKDKKSQHIANFLTASHLDEAKALYKTIAANTNEAGIRQMRDSGNLNKLIEELPQNVPADFSGYKLVSCWPYNQLELLVDGLYPKTDKSLSDLQAQVDSWKYEQKLDALTVLLREGEMGVLGQTNYQFDGVDDQVALEQLYSLGLFDSLLLQPITPRFGYSVPELISEAGLEEKFIGIFDSSLEIFSDLQATGFENEASYVCLKGHKSRWQFKTNAQNIYDSLSSEITPRQKNILKELISQISEQHPIISQYLLEKLKSKKFMTNKASAFAPKKASKTSKQKYRSKRRK